MNHVKKIISPDQLRRGLLLSWYWGDNAVGKSMIQQDIAPAGRLVTIADVPYLSDCNIGLQVDDYPHLVLDPALAISKGKSFDLIEDCPEPSVLNKKTARNTDDAVYIGRPSPWGNPFSIGKDGDRDEVIRKYTAYLHRSPDLVRKARLDLAGRDLICWCHPAPCHGHILRDIALGRDLPEIPLKNQMNLGF